MTCFLMLHSVRPPLVKRWFTNTAHALGSRPAAALHKETAVGALRSEFYPAWVPGHAKRANREDT